MIHKEDPFKANFDSLEEFADRISDLLQCPITIEDANHRLIAYSAHDDYTDPARTATIISRRVPEKVINSLWKTGVIPALLSSEEPLRVETISDVGLGNRVAVSIWKNNEVIGFIWALETGRTLSKDDMELLKKAAKAAKNKVLQLYMRKNKREERVQEFFWKLLTGHIKTNEEIHENFSAMQIPAAPRFSVLVFRFANGITSDLEKQISYILQTTQQVQVLLYTVERNDFILLVAPKSADQPLYELNQFISSFATKMKERFHINSIQSSFGGIYETFEYIEKSYKEALTVLSMKEKFPEQTFSIYGYQQLGIYQFFDLLLEKKQQGEFANSALTKLQAYDEKHHTNLIETYEAFFDHDSNVNETAKALNIHPNTLSYRLKRIAEIGEIDLHNMNQKVKLYIDIKLAKYEALH
ncbi:MULTISPECIES: PucR family transcriptional regulator [Anoxybacillaceae]|uniref:PucR family transcriptional regulator n=1 Tax=Anoxybacillaceae TaxID=3120669 RepID=UPI00131839D6|nr:MULTISPECIES: PucR family transcriptional regulator [Anoxybacillus]MBB3908238.1 DNA-binding PucR family transcriptional regulator [Anoxybacillus rupiensis]MBS2771409.1 PucR family transcriptional regulator [Anoxybacillus rupiensis]QHC05617.1 PucR family transcriptional regulator [Anoxybacillus sp. PDR2]